MDWIRDLIRPLLEKIEGYFWSDIDKNLEQENQQASKVEEELREARRISEQEARNSRQEAAPSMFRLDVNIEDVEEYDNGPALGFDGSPPVELCQTSEVETENSSDENELPGIGSGTLVSERSLESDTVSDTEDDTEEIVKTVSGSESGSVSDTDTYE